MGKIDLHIHTTASDGTDAPTQAVALAAQAGVRVLALCDHDTVAGVLPAIEAGRELGVQVLPGVEFSADWNGREVHLLGYGFEPAAEQIAGCCAWSVQERAQRNREMARRLAKLGHPVDLAVLEQTHPVVGRPHFAQELIRQGAAASVADAFARFLSPGTPGFVQRRLLPLGKLTEAIRGAGGVAVLAHPMHYGLDASVVRALVADAAEMGIQGLEVYYAANSAAQTADSEALAREHGLLRTGGSDYHGARKPGLRIGMADVPEEILPPLLARARYT